jgi:acetylglutamate kinase
LRQEVAFNRVWVHGICKTINELRNRVAHHEPLVNGFPLNGQNHRMTTETGHEQIRTLTRMVDRKLATWLDTNTSVPRLLQNRPQ